MFSMISYLLFRLFTFPLSYLPYSWLRKIARGLTPLAYLMLVKWRKRALSNIALISGLTQSNQEIKKLAKRCFKNLLITCLEYPKLAREKHISKLVYCDNPETADQIMAKGKGIIFFCGHQSNWELLFLEGTSRMPGVAIGRPIKNRYLYAWIKHMREKYGGLIVTPKEAVKEGLRALKKGKFLGIVGDQGMPDSGFCCPFLGRLAWTSPLPALLATRSGAPIIVASVIREKTKYRIHYSEAIYPNAEAPTQTEVDRLMRTTLLIFEKSLLNHPEQWLWIHNRWKQQTRDRMSSKFRHDALAIFLPDDKQLAKEINVFRIFYPTEFIALFVPKKWASLCHLKEAEMHIYETPDELFKEDYRFKLIFNFTKLKSLERHYKRLSALTTVQIDSQDKSLLDILKLTIGYAG